jgi:ssDNA-binding Zn-finger/Zn-ribbon topoisomerase 1
MPTHQYKCKTPVDNNQTLCEHEYEVFYTSFKKVEEEEQHEKCPKCDGVIKERQFSGGGSGFILRGGGWAKDKYGR